MKRLYACNIHSDIDKLLGNRIKRREMVIAQLACGLFTEEGVLGKLHASGFLCDLERAVLNKNMSNALRLELLGKIGSCIYYYDGKRCKKMWAQSRLMHNFTLNMIKRVTHIVKGARAYYVSPSIAKKMLDYLYGMRRGDEKNSKETSTRRSRATSMRDEKNSKGTTTRHSRENSTRRSRATSMRDEKNSKGTTTRHSRETSTRRSRATNMRDEKNSKRTTTRHSRETSTRRSRATSMRDEKNSKRTTTRHSRETSTRRSRATSMRDEKNSKGTTTRHSRETSTRRRGRISARRRDEKNSRETKR